MFTQIEIEEINKQCPYNQGIFVQPYGIPTKIKEAVIYSRYETGGYSGGSCYDDSDSQPYYSEKPKDNLKVLDIVLAKVFPNISYLQFKEVESLIHDNSETEYEYYGNSIDWHIDYIKLSDLENKIKEFKQ